MNSRDAGVDGTAEALHRYGITPVSITPLNVGLINRTWLVADQKSKYILQLVNPMFSAEVHEDIATVTRHLHAKGVTTPRLLTTADNHYYVRVDTRLWRMYNYLEGVTYNTLDDPGLAYEAGLALGRFHKALLDLDYRFKNRRPGVHDTPRHLNILRKALDSNQDHPRYKDVLPLGREILEQAGHLPALPHLETRKVHGDPKINNVLFDKSTLKAVCMVDFDTLGDMVLPLELGDAMRSWCNPAGENTEETRFSLDIFRAGLKGYAESAKDFITETEWNSILPATRIIYIELASRFCADALNEDFFGWDSERYPSHSVHSQVRAVSQLNAGKSLEAQIKQAERILADNRPL
jgi:Ser/Thr protein kinase RdoA (MazF antagonist)